jgi:hypothetical protein
MGHLVSENGYGHAVCALASGQALAELLAAAAERAMALDQLTRLLRFLFVFGFPRSEPSDYALHHLSAGGVALGGQTQATEVTYQISSERPQLTTELTGRSFVSFVSASDSCFVAKSNSAPLSILATAGGNPFLVILPRFDTTLFLSAGSEMVDLDAPAGDDFAVSSYFSRLVPVVMFLRLAFGDQIWHTPNPLAANLIIDDPWLRQNYGFINFPSLLQKADELDFAATLAFIPWNYRRSERSTVELFRSRPDRFGVCVHGCDHVADEFALTDLGRLNSIVGLATCRMKTHEERTGLSFVKAMVFPQGHFSPASLLALKCNGYLASINTHVMPQGVTNGEGLAVRDFLDLAITKYHGFPVFRRRYPESASEFPFDLYMGKPLFIAEHHGFLRGGFGRLSALVQNIRQIAPDIRWRSALEILLKSYRLRKASPTELECKFFSTAQIIENAEHSDMDFTIIKHEPAGDLVRKVMVNGRPAEFTIHDALIKTSVRIPAGGNVRVELEYVNNLPCPQIKPSIKSKSKIAMRRYLSEFRDNVIAKNEAVLSAATFMKKRLF